MSFVVGSTASDRASAIASEGNTVINLNNPSTGAGTMTSAEMWFDTADADGSGVKVGLFYLTTTSTMNYKCRSSYTVGAVTKGSAQSVAVALTVAVGDYIGWYCADGRMERDTSGGAGLLWVTGDQCTAGVASTYALLADDIASINGTCSTGWASITTILDKASASILTINDKAVANIASVNGKTV